MLIYGLPAVHDEAEDWDDRNCIEGGCEVCQEVCLSFPLDQIVSLSSSVAKCYFPNKLGNNVWDKIMYIMRRPRSAHPLVEARKNQLYRDLLRQVELQIVDYEDEQYDEVEALAIFYDFNVMTALTLLKRDGYDAASVADANLVVTQACKQALAGVRTRNDYLGQYPHWEKIHIMRNDFRTLVNEFGIELDEDEFALVPDDRTSIYPLSG